MRINLRTLLTLCLVLIPSASFSQTPASRGWIDVNFGLAASGAGDVGFVYETTLFREPAAFAAYYPEPSRGAAFDFGGGYMFTPRIGIGASFVGTAHEDIVGLGATIPHPFYFNASGIGSSATEETLSRIEGSANIHAMVVALETNRLRVRVFGGPTFFQYRADMVQDLRYTQFATILSLANSITITEYREVEVDGTGIGFHAGGDVSVFFSRVFGLGGFARYSRGTISIDEPLSENPEDVTVGGFQVGGGVRLRF